MPDCWKCKTELKEDADLCPKCNAHQRPSNFSHLLTVQSALLDFYSDRAVAHASFLLASIFGLVTSLAIVQQMISQTLINPSQTLSFLIYFSLVPFGALGYLGYYTLRRFGAYAAAAHELVRKFRQYAPEDIAESVAKSTHKADRELIIRRVLIKLQLKFGLGARSLALYVGYWLLIISLSSVVYWQSEDTIVHGLWVLITFVILPIAIFWFKVSDVWLEKRVRKSLSIYLNCRQNLKWIHGQIKGIRKELLNRLMDEFKPQYGRTQKFRQLAEELKKKKSF